MNRRCGARRAVTPAKTARLPAVRSTTRLEAWRVPAAPSAYSNSLAQVGPTAPSSVPTHSSGSNHELPVSLGNVDQLAAVRGIAVTTITTSHACAVATTAAAGADGWAIDTFEYNRSNDANPQSVEQIERTEHRTTNGSLESSSQLGGATPPTMGWSVSGTTCSRAVHLVVTIGPS